MKISNFIYEGKINGGTFEQKEFASVDVTTGVLFKKTVRRRICLINANWFFVDTGCFTPGYQAEDLARSWSAQQ